MKKLRCESCGGELRIEENGEYANCDYCRTRYKLNEDKTLVIKLDDSVKEIGKNIKTAAIPFIIMGVTFVMFFIVIFGIILYEQHQSSSDYDSNVQKQQEMFESNVQTMQSDGTKMEKEYKVSNFNLVFNMYVGTQPKFFVEKLLDEVNTSNQEKDRDITVEYNNKSMLDFDEIVEFKHNLKNQNYEVKYAYDNDGYITKVILKDVK